MKKAAGVFALACFVACMGANAPEPDFYRGLAARWAPVIWQDTGGRPEADYITAYDGDGDDVCANNLESLMAGRFEPYPAHVYYFAAETETHYIVIYEFFHPFDYERPLLKLVRGTQHENDAEGVMIVAAQSDTELYGEFRLMITRPHGQTRLYTDQPGVMARGPRRASKPVFTDGHPAVYVQKGGHGPYGLGARGNGLTVRRGFHGDTGVIYRCTGRAGGPRGPNDRDVGYDLISITDPRGPWTNRCNRASFSGYKEYRPPTERPGVPEDLTCGGMIPFDYAGDTAGESHSADVASLPWAHYGPDPALLVGRYWELPEEFSLTYRYNPVLGIGGLKGKIEAGPEK